MSFTPLQVLSSYSLLSSTIKIDELVKSAKEMGYEYLALTDQNVMYGTIAFYEACQKYDIKPILGLTLTLAAHQDEENESEFILLAKNNQGYHQLMEISSKKMTQSKLTFTEIADDLSDVFVIIPSIHSEFSTLLNRSQPVAAQQELAFFSEKVPAENLFIGISNNNQISHILIDTIQEMAQKVNIRTLPLTSVKYLHQSDYFAYQVQNNIRDSITLPHPENVNKDIVGKNWFKTPQEYQSDFQKIGLKHELDNLSELLDKIDSKIEFSKPQLPKFETPNNLSAIDYLTRLCQQELVSLALNEKIDYQKRLRFELETIDKMGFADYFLIIADVVRFAKGEHILMGPGRGSAAGSLVAYLLRITQVDPIQYQLLFERFLNPARHQMPDIDLDVPDDKRKQVLNYVHQKYGQQRVGQIITFNTLAAKQSIRDVAKVFGEMPQKIAQISGLIPSKPGITLQQAFNQSNTLQRFVNENNKNKLIFITAQALEGLPKNYSIHAAGIVLSQNELTKRVPVQQVNEEMLVSQYSKNYVEKVGLLKMDFLGLRNLSFLARILKKVQKQIPTFKLADINLNDEKTLQLFQDGDTTGVFQFESRGIRQALRKVKPDNFNLVVAVNALYRPGPMENIDRFVRRKNGQEAYHFPNEVLQNILGETFGILVYQEQVMQVASSMGGFTLSEADLLRRAMSKKHQAEIESMKNQFIKGAQNRGYSEKMAVQVYQYIERFADYGFNKSHAVAYSKLAFQLAYFKAHFPAVFYLELLNSTMGNTEKLVQYVKELKRMSINILAPNINQAMPDYQLKGSNIMIGFLAIKHIRRDFVNNIVENRAKNGKFKTFVDFLIRIKHLKENVEMVKSLIKAGAFDEFNSDRLALMNYLGQFIDFLALDFEPKSKLWQQMLPKIEQTDFKNYKKLDQEKEVLGLAISKHPVERFHDEIVKRHLPSIVDLKNNQLISMYVLLKNVRNIRTKKGEPMAFGTLDDDTGDIEAVIFPAAYKQNGFAQLKIPAVVEVSGRVDEHDGKKQLIINRLKQAHQRNGNHHWLIKVPTRVNSPKLQKALNNIFEAYRGDYPVMMQYQDTGIKTPLPEKFDLDYSEELLNKLKILLGKINVEFK